MRFRIVSVATTIALSAAMLSSVSGAAGAAIDPLTAGTTPATAAASCWEIKQLRPAAGNGAYWLWTPRMAQPQQFYCDMTTSGGGWVLVGKGRSAWDDGYAGKHGRLDHARSGDDGPHHEPVRLGDDRCVAQWWARGRPVRRHPAAPGNELHRHPVAGVASQAREPRTMGLDLGTSTL